MSDCKRQGPYGFIPSGLEKESKTLTSKQTQKQFQSLRHETGVDQRLRAVGGEQNVCKRAQHLGDGDTQGIGAKQSTQVMDVGVEGSTSDMLVRVLSHVAPLGFIESNDRLW